MLSLGLSYLFIIFSLRTNTAKNILAHARGTTSQSGGLRRTDDTAAVLPAQHEQRTPRGPAGSANSASRAPTTTRIEWAKGSRRRRRRRWRGPTTSRIRCHPCTCTVDVVSVITTTTTIEEWVCRWWGTRWWRRATRRCWATQRRDDVHDSERVRFHRPLHSTDVHVHHHHTSCQNLACTRLLYLFVFRSRCPVVSLGTYPLLVVLFLDRRRWVFLLQYDPHRWQCSCDLQINWQASMTTRYTPLVYAEPQRHIARHQGCPHSPPARGARVHCSRRRLTRRCFRLRSKGRIRCCAQPSVATVR